MDKTRKLRRELGYEIAKLHGLQESVDLTLDDDSTKALALQVREQAGMCLHLLDQYQSSVPSRMWFDADRRCRPLREDLRRTEKLFRSNSGEWDGRTITRADIYRVCDWTWEDFREPDDGAFDSEFADGESEPAPGALLAPPREVYEFVETDDILEAYDPPVPDELEVDSDDDEDVGGASPASAWRFTLPMDEESPGHVLMVLVASPTGLAYEHQYGGATGRRREVEGFLVPARAEPEAKAELEQFFLSDFLSDPGGDGANEPDHEGAALDGVREAVRQIQYRGTAERLAPLELDEARLGELDEAWVPVRTPDGPGYLAWVNAD